MQLAARELPGAQPAFGGKDAKLGKKVRQASCVGRAPPLRSCAGS